MDAVERISQSLKSMTHAERQRVADASGVPVATVQKIALRQTKNPRYNTVKALAAVLTVPEEIPSE